MKRLLPLILCFILCACGDRKEIPSIPNSYKTLYASPFINMDESRPSSLYFLGGIVSFDDILNCDTASKFLNRISELCATDTCPAKTPADFRQELQRRAYSSFSFTSGETSLRVRCLYKQGNFLDTMELSLSGPDFGFIYDALKRNLIFAADEVNLKFVYKEAEYDDRHH